MGKTDDNMITDDMMVYDEVICRRIFKKGPKSLTYGGSGLLVVNHVGKIFDWLLTTVEGGGVRNH